MAGRVKRGRGRLMESVGALTDNKRLKDKGRRATGRGNGPLGGGQSRTFVRKSQGKVEWGVRAVIATAAIRRRCRAVQQPGQAFPNDVGG